MIFRSVNSYLAITKDGKTKKKGEFITLPEIGNSVNFLVIPKLLEQYFLHGIKPSTILENPDKYGLHIYDFCCSMKVDKSYTVEWMNQKQQRLNRFYVSRKGGYIYKCRKGTKTHMLKGWGVMIYNNHLEKPLTEYNIDMRFYLSEVNSMIAELENKNQYELI